MTKQSSEATDLRQTEAAEAQESDIRELAPAPGTPEAEAVREQVQAIAEVKELPAFNEAKEELTINLANIEKGQHKELRKAIDKYGLKSVKIITIRPSRDGWNAEGREDGPFTKEQSEEFASLINAKIDTEKMKAEAEQRREEKEAKNAAKSKPEEVQEAPDAYADLIERTENVQSLNDLTAIVAHCREFELLVVSGDRSRWQVKALDGNERSQKLAKTIESKKVQFLKEIADKKRVKEILQKIEYTPNAEELDKGTWSLHQEGWVEKKFIKGNSILKNWKAEPIKDKEGSKKIADALNQRREDFVKAEEAENRAKLPGNRR